MANKQSDQQPFVNMDFWVLLLFTLAVPLTSCRAGAQSTITTSITSDTASNTTTGIIISTTNTSTNTGTTTTNNTAADTTTTSFKSTITTGFTTNTTSDTATGITASTTTTSTNTGATTTNNTATDTTTTNNTATDTTTTNNTATDTTTTGINAITTSFASTTATSFTTTTATADTADTGTTTTASNTATGITTNTTSDTATGITVTATNTASDIIPNPTTLSTVSHTTDTTMFLTPPATASFTTTTITTTTKTISTTTTTNTTTPANTTTTTTPNTTTPTTTISTTTTTTATTTTPPPPWTTSSPNCINGGTLLSGICVCPDKWHGETCSVENFCQAGNYSGFKFQETVVGWFAYSDERCEKGTIGAGKPKALTQCSIKNGSPAFELPPTTFQCDQTLDEIQQNLTSGADLESLAANTQILTSIPEDLTAENVTVAAQIANMLLLSPNATENVRVAAVATVSQLLNTNASDNRGEINATVGLTKTLEQLSLNLSRLDSASQSQVVQQNLVVQSALIPAANTQGVQFTSLSGGSGNFSMNRIQLNTNVSKVENELVADAVMYVRFPPQAGRHRQGSSNISLGFVLYQNDRFFRSKHFRRERVTFRVLSASMEAREHSMVPQSLEMLFRPTMLNGTTLYDFACVSWDYELEDWSTEGCSKGNASDGAITCFCKHMTNFAALWSFRENYEYPKALDYISYLGLSVSILGLVISIVHHIRESFLRRSQQQNSNPKVALLCIYVSLLAFIITFLSGVQNSSRQNDAPVQVGSQTNSVPASEEWVEPDKGSCSVVAALLQFFLLSTFMWCSVYSTQLVLLVRTMQISLPLYCGKLSLAVGWGVPAVVMAITLGASYRVDDPLGYRQEEFCWLAALDKAKRFNYGKPMFWGFILPVALILFYNLVLLVLASMTTCSTDPKLRSTKTSNLRKRFLISFSLAVLLGLSWTLGYLVLVTSEYTLHLTFSILFCLCTTTQGFQIFILFTARTPTFKATVSHSARFIKTQSQMYSLIKSSRKTSSSEFYRNLRDESTDDPMSFNMETRSQT